MMTRGSWKSVLENDWVVAELDQRGGERSGVSVVKLRGR